MSSIRISHSNLFGNFFCLDMMWSKIQDSFLVLGKYFVGQIDVSLNGLFVLDLAPTEVFQFLLVCLDDCVSVLLYHLLESLIDGFLEGSIGVCYGPLFLYIAHDIWTATLVSFPEAPQSVSS